jgi:hypothetical protein
VIVVLAVLVGAGQPVSAAPVLTGGQCQMKKNFCDGACEKLVGSFTRNRCKRACTGKYNDCILTGKWLD